MNAKMKITQAEFYSNEILKRTPRGNTENKRAFEAIVREQENYEIPECGKWTMADY